MSKHDYADGKDTRIETLTSKESEDLFRIAFKNYLDLVGLADRKAGLLIQVNSILAPVVGISITRLNEGSFYIIPITILLIGTAITIFYGILASRPISKTWDSGMQTGNEEFFFGSFDRLDPQFKSVTWEKYSKDIGDFFRSDQKIVFDELIKESFQVRKVLSIKFGYLSVAYKVFFAALLLSLIGFIIIFTLGYL